eukprot:TRINITY_DN8305_c0_g1_i1.p1 TRINITY_DN8305_c0_g1~~TRINITY_DN8305_c0_g1_i1.p1  ORF type:complete len:451 (+),score=93.14 TRINITY_DN8305_c0_g1_i1:204-1355(+)
MVSTEARKKAQVEQELVETRTRLEMEDELINELKEKLVKLAESSRKKRKKISKKSRNAKSEKEKKSPKSEATIRVDVEETVKPIKDKRDIISGGFSSRSEIDLDSEMSEFLTDMSDASETSSMRLGRTITQLEFEEDVFDSETSKLYGFFFAFTTYKMEPDAILLKGFQEIVNEPDNWESHWLCKQTVQIDVDPCLDFGRSKKVLTSLSGKRSFLRFSSSSQPISISEFHTSMKNNTFLLEPIIAETASPSPPTSPLTLVKNKRGRLKLSGVAGGSSGSLTSSNSSLPISSSNSSSASLPATLESCYLCSREAQCNFRIKLSEKAPWYKVCLYCRSRLVAVCEFYRYVRNLKAGMYQNSNLMDTFLDWTRLRIFLNAVQTMSV